ncbi:hypothetical protein [Polluticaenibacter yanchengensis]|uniref:Glycosyltransferase RgtA/B/C/D-like domain-containing protein n=1 Tax=Polluticaenibacter yanchengensis TaxID=3014562 RepID=A0ABT4UIK7_9BACT|nr:hypothetical protein [Chitinophagaceae bacterium LY-5]
MAANIFTQYILPVIYLVLIGVFFARSKSLKRTGFSTGFKVGFAWLKCLAGVVYAYVMMHLIPKGDDVGLLFGGGLEIYNAFLNDPTGFPAYLAKMFAINDFRLGHTDSDFIRTVFEGIKFIHFVLDLFSFGNLYTNVILFNGTAAFLFLKCWQYLKSHLGTLIAGAFIFLFPSSFFYSSGILKEGLMLFLMAATIPLVIKFRRHPQVKILIGAGFCMLLMFFFKFLIAVTFAGGLFLWWLFSRFPNQKWQLAMLVTALSVTAFFGAGLVTDSLNLPNYIIDRQAEFLNLEANSVISYPQLEPDFFSFAKNLPLATVNAMVRPFPGDGGKLMYMVYALEMLVFWVCMVWIIIKGKRRMLNKIPAFVWAMFLFAIANLLIIGYSIPNIGSITRYRSIFMPFIGLFIFYWFNGWQVLQPVLAMVKKRFKWTNVY